MDGEIDLTLPGLRRLINLMKRAEGIDAGEEVQPDHNISRSLDLIVSRGYSLIPCISKLEAVLNTGKSAFNPEILGANVRKAIFANTE